MTRRLPTSPNGKREAIEACDKNDLGNATCASAVAPGWIGTLSCDADCAFDTSQCKPPITTFNDITVASNWSKFDTAAISPKAAGFFGAAFDGRYVYFVPNSADGSTPSGLVLRYDTLAAFDTMASWSTFDVTTVDASAKETFAGAAFDGRYLYLVPYTGTGNVALGTVVRLDTTAPFNAKASWSTFDVTSVGAAAKGFNGAIFDGRYLYLVPKSDGGQNAHGNVARFDTLGSFQSTSSWSTFDLATVNPAAKGFFGGTFDGRYVYMTNVQSGPLLARLDTLAPFDVPASWSFLDVSMVVVGAPAFTGATFDGQYIYLTPYNSGADASGLVARYDPKGPLDKQASWSSFDASTVTPSARGFKGSVFDGRYVYFVPDNNGTPISGNTDDGLVARYDTTAAFVSKASWSTFDMTSSLGGAAKGYLGGAFDGRYLYLAPSANAGHVVTRFDAKTPSWLPKGWNASFL